MQKSPIVEHRFSLVKPGFLSRLVIFVLLLSMTLSCSVFSCRQFTITLIITLIWLEPCTSSSESDKEKILALLEADLLLKVSASDLGGEGGNRVRLGRPGTFLLPLGVRIPLIKAPRIG